MRALLAKKRTRWSRRGNEELGRCQVRSKTDRPCPRPAAVEIRGVPFCERCAREQQAYFAIGELTQEETRGFRDGPLAEALGRAWRGRRGRVATVETERVKVTVGKPE
jgi:hypothetical protein